jgi:hypothetical protein
MQTQLTGWLQCVEPFPGNHAIFDQFEILFIGAGAPANCALFSRQSNDLKEHIYLLTPAAAAWASLLPGQWTDAGDPREHRWTGLIMHSDAAGWFGLETPAR